MDSAATSLLATVGILAVIPGFSVLYREFLDRSGVRRSARLTAPIAAGSLLVWLLVSLLLPSVASSPLEFPTGALAALAGFLSSLTVRDVTTDAVPALVFSLAWTALVFTPVALVALFPGAIGMDATTSALDLGGALPLHVGIGASALVLLTAARRWAVPDHSHIRPRSWLLLASGAVIWAGSIVGLVGLEVSVDAVVTPLIVTNAIVAPICGALGWVVVQRIRTASTTPIGVVAGLVSGIVSITAGAAYFTPLWAGVTSAVAGIVASVFVSGRIRATGRHAWFIVGAHLVAAAIGLIMVGLFSTDFGLIYQGQVTLVATQFVAVIAAAIWSVGVSVLLWFAIRRLVHHSHRRSTEAGQA